jgi:periplasmic divalent cation tolerance protein
MLHFIFVTHPELNAAKKFVSTLVEEKLVACGNIVPGLTSIYRWQGAVETAAECLIVLKTAEDLLPKLEHRIKELHPYDVPEIVAVRTDRVNEAYAQWVGESVTG